MPVSTELPAPYAPGSVITGLLERSRSRGLIAPITKDVLMRAGVSDSLAPRTFQSLQALDLIDESGQPTSMMTKLRTAPESDYKSVMAEWVQSAYAEVFQFADPRHDDAVRIRDAFRAYSPHGQQDRMVSLFMSLCVEAGIIDANSVERKPAGRKAGRPGAAMTSKRPVPAAVEPPSRFPVPAPPFRTQMSAGLPPALAGMLESIPKDGSGWTKADRDKFLSTFGAVLDFVVPIVASQPTAPVVASEQDAGGTS